LITTILAFVVVIGIIVFVHEFGHFIAAKLSRVRVEVFSLGFPPKMIGRKFGETEYQIAWIPLGGYVKMSGMSDESMDENYNPDDPRGFTAQNFGRKIFIITAGVLMNVLLAFLIYSVITWTEGVSRLTGTALTIVTADSPAEKAGMVAGDEVVMVAGQPVKDWASLTNIIRANGGREIEIQWRRNDSLCSTKLVPEPTAEFNLATAKTDIVGKIGVLGTFTTESVGPIAALGYGATQVWWVVKLNVISLSALLTGRARLNDLTGPIGIAKLSGESVRSGFANFVAFIALISVSIGFLNLMPIPMLDGGHLLFIIVESAIRRRIPDKIKINLMRVGLAALLLLVALVSYHDIVKIFFTRD